jgi:poly(3-hydroxybutyrate) depolymerase
MHEMTHFGMAPARAISDVARTWLENPINPLSYTAAGRNLAASAKIFERLTRRYGKPAFDLATTVVGGKIVPIVEVVVWERPFCKLLHFETQPSFAAISLFRRTARLSSFCTTTLPSSPRRQAPQSLR